MEPQTPIPVPSSSSSSSSWEVQQTMQLSEPIRKGMEHVVGQIYHHYDYPLTEIDMKMRDLVYVISMWRCDSTKKYIRSREKRKNSGNEVHDVIRFHAGIDEDSSRALSQHLQYLNSIDFDTGFDVNGNPWIQPIWIEIMSPGGSVQSGIQMRCEIESSRRPVVPILSGMCASAATFMFTANQNQRLMQAASILLIHQMSKGGGLSMKQVEWEAETNNTGIWQSQVMQFYYGLRRPHQYSTRMFGPTSLMNSKGVVRPYTEEHTPNDMEMERGLVADFPTYCKKVKSLMEGIDRYMSSLVALKYGFATNIFTSWEDEEKRQDSPAYFQPGSPKTRFPPEGGQRRIY